MSSSSKGKKETGNDSKFFSNSNKKGEVHELRQELHHQNRDKKKDAVKKVIANMTVGKDVTMYFTDIVNCMQTADIELKKLVYLYLINYAKSNPDLAILAVNTFVMDAADPNPLIRALAVRTMGCIRVERISEHLCDPLNQRLRDQDPYVRKTAAVCVAKLYDISPELVENQGFLDVLRDLICDSNPTVVANAVAALSEIQESSGKNVFQVNPNVLQKLMAALNECTEWGQIFILDALARFVPDDSKTAEEIIERVTPRLQHANSAVVMSAVKVMMRYLDVVTNMDTVRALAKKMAPPLVTLLSTEPEIQYVALRNINLIVQKRPNILSHEIKVFFCKYNDPIYVKMEKLEIIIRLVSERNVDQVLLELKEYAQEVDVDFVRKSVRAIGRCAIKLERSAEKCIHALTELIKTKVNYVVQEVVIVVKDIFRKYPNRYESIISTLAENLENLDEQEAKASMIWIIGEYAERMDNADELLASFLDNFHDETSMVQLQLLTAVVKMFLKQPENTSDLVQRVLQMATAESDNPDLRDRGFVYWRLLSSNPDAAKAVVLAEKPVIADDSYSLDSGLLTGLIGQLATLASVYHKPPEAFVTKSLARLETQDMDEDDDADYNYEVDAEASTPQDAAPAAAAPVDLLDMGGMDDALPTPPPAQNGGNLMDDMMGGGGGGGAPPSGTMPVPKCLVVNNEQGQGVEVSACFSNASGNLTMDFEYANNSQQPMTTFAIQFDKNSMGLVPGNQQIEFATPLNPMTRAVSSIPISADPNSVSTTPPEASVKAATKNMATGQVVYFACPVYVHTLLSPNGSMEKQDFLGTWKGVNDQFESQSMISDIRVNTIDSVKGRFAAHSIFHVGCQQEDQELLEFFCGKTINGWTLLFELTFKAGVNACKLCIKSDPPQVAALAQPSIEFLLKN